MTHARTSLALLAAAALAAAGCGSTQGTGSASRPAAPRSHSAATTTTPEPTSSSLDGLTLQSVTTLDSDIRQQMQRYLGDLQTVRTEVTLANRAAAHEASISSSGDYAALAADSRNVARHLARATELTRRVQPPHGLERAHARLVRAFALGQQMATRLATLYDHIGPDSQREFREQVRPLERRSLRCANVWYSQAAAAMAAGNIRSPKWIDHLFDWS
jgi:hypothetical protein